VHQATAHLHCLLGFELNLANQRVQVRPQVFSLVKRMGVLLKHHHGISFATSNVYALCGFAATSMKQQKT
jgi:hypothetical protein